MTKTEYKVQNFVSQKHLLEDGQRVLIALSGGADSVCLLLLMQRLGYKCSAAHCNFHLRGEESDRDESFVTDLCQRLSVPLHKTDFDTYSYAHEHGVSIEMAARELRYDFFCKVAKETGVKTLCVGHHRDDNVETFLLNAIRGTGVVGLSGIKESRMEKEMQIVRPLLCLSRDEILAYLESREQSFVTDSTNLIDDVGRNKVRLDVIPVLRSINTAAIDNLATTINNMKEVQKVYEASIKADIERCREAEGMLSIEELLSSVSPSSVLHEWLSGKGFNRSQEQDILNAAINGQSGKMFEANKVENNSDLVECLIVDRASLILESSLQYISPSDIKMQTMPISEVKINKDSRFAYLDADKLEGKLSVRLVKSSDTFQPFGMRGRKLLSDFMTNLKLNLFQKRHQLVVTDGEEIAWVVGLRSSEKYRIDKDTKNVIVLSI